ncbi:hypothetical protein [uncultured Rummeliibacillus sp.]|uniref:hypothetical protein n=1 Tax=uncultured Rummeliibacillus sp. TaxID=762292 RepID=UPI00261D9A38|nr:hypothetical protein [uncultured Rummeliibacillus sp.]
MNDFFNYRLDTSNLEDKEGNLGNRMQRVIGIWNKLTVYFLTKGTKLTIHYYDNDIIYPKKGYPSTGYGVKNIILSESQCKRIENEDNLIELTISLNESIKNIIFKSMVEEIDSEYENITPFFHFNILDKNGLSIFTSQDYGCNTLMYLTMSDIKELSLNENEKLFFVKISENK